MRTLRLLAIVEANTITGPAKNLLRFAEAVRSSELEPRISVSIATFERGAGKNLFIDTARARSIDIYPVPEGGRFDQKAFSRLSRLARDLKPDIIQSHAVKSHFATRFAGLNRIAPWIAFHHGYTWPDMRARLYNQLDRWSLRAADRIVTVSLPFRNQMIRMGVRPERITVIHNAIDAGGLGASTPESRAALRSELGLGPEKKILLIVGRLSREKDHETLLQALHYLNATSEAGGNFPAHLVIVGDGPERAAIERTAAKLHLESSISLVGQIPSADPYYGIADVCVLSSQSEGSPNALLEAMAARVPVVATSVGGIPEMVSHNESALLVRPGEPREMAQAIAALVSNRELRDRLASNAFQTVLDRYTPQKRMQQLVDVYCQILQRPADKNK